MKNGTGNLKRGRPHAVATFCTALVIAVAFLAAPRAPLAQDPAQTRHPEIDAPAPQPPPAVRQRYLISKFPDKPSIPPSLSVPLEPLGFVAPGPIYLGARNALASLGFLDENRLLFTFRVPGLLHRDEASDDDTAERQIRAIVLDLPQGALESEAQWTVHDRSRYIWILKDGHFLLRDRNSLSVGDASLKLKPLLDFPGRLLWLDLDPSQKFMVTNSREPAAKPSTPGSGNNGTSSSESKPGDVTSPATASANLTTDDDSGSDDTTNPDLVVRILRRDTNDVMLVSRTRAPVHLPINSQGYLENLRGKGDTWTLNLSFFTGGSKMLGNVDSNCQPTDDFLSENEILVTGCGLAGESKLTAISTAGRTLWATQAPATEIWPQLAVSANGLRLAWETLDTDHSINSFSPIGSEDIKEQSVSVFDASTGDIALVSPISPILDIGGNIAISPSGRRVALLNAGAIQVFELPAPPTLPTLPDKHPSH